MVSCAVLAPAGTQPACVLTAFAHQLRFRQPDLAATAKCLRLEHKARLWKRSILPVWLLGFLCDFLGAGLVGLLIYLIEGGLSGDSLFFPAATLYALPGVVLSGVLIYTLNRFLSFRKSGLEKGQLHKLCLSLAVFTAPYLMMIPIYGMKSPTS